MRLPIQLLFLIATASLLIAGCGSTGLSGATPTPTPTPAELSNRIADATSASESIHFTLTLTGKPVYADTSSLFIVSSVEGDMQRPDSALATLKVRSALTITEVRLVSLAGRIYATNPVTRQWQCFEPGQVFDPVVLFDDETGVTHLLRNAFEDITLVGTEELEGIPHYHLRGSITGEILSGITYGLLGVGLVQVDLWAEVESLRVTQVVMVDSGTDPENPSTWTMTFSDYDKQVDVHAPVEACP